MFTFNIGSNFSNIILLASCFNFLLVFNSFCVFSIINSFFLFNMSLGFSFLCFYNFSLCFFYMSFSNMLKFMVFFLTFFNIGLFGVIFFFRFHVLNNFLISFFLMGCFVCNYSFFWFCFVFSWSSGLVGNFCLFMLNSRFWSFFLMMIVWSKWFL